MRKKCDIIYGVFLITDTFLHKNFLGEMPIWTAVCDDCMEDALSLKRQIIM